MCLSASRRDSAGQPVAEPVHLGAHPVRVGPRVLAQRPADRLAQPERRCRRRWPRRRAGAAPRRCRPCGRPGRSRRYAAATGPRRSPTPRITGVAAGRWWRSTSPTRWVATSSTTSHHAPVTTRCRQRSRLAGSSHSRARRCRATAIAAYHSSRWVASSQSVRTVASHCPRSAGTPVPQQRPQHGLEPRRRQPVVGHRRLHVGLLLGGDGGVAGRGERPSYGLDERHVCGGGVGHPPQTRALRRVSPARWPW